MYRVLIVEEDRNCRETLEMADWPSFGFGQVCVAANYTQAVSLIAQGPFHLALISVTLGERLSGELAAQLREKVRDAVCCLLSNHLDDYRARWAMRSGFRDVLKRPPDTTELEEFLEWVMLTQIRGVMPRKRDDTPGKDPVLGREYAAFGPITNRVLSVVHNDYRSALSLTEIARHLEMNSKYIGRVFTRETGLRFTDYLMAYRMQEAGRLIRNTNEKISAVARMVGYSQPNNFYTHFRQYFGVSPSSLRGGTQEEEAS